ncbi:MAG: DUF2029 domain-containing protein [Geminicoccaceae bacterium]|nr:DUF2029 domain-containing protein [Geminicoccaceae bacterium]
MNATSPQVPCDLNGPDATKTNLVLPGIILAIGLAMNLAQIILALGNGSQPSDFFVFWSAACFMAGNDPGSFPAIYDPLALADWQNGLPFTSGKIHPFAYPPTLLLFLRPLAALDYGTARILWLAVSFAVLGLAVGAHRRPVLWLVLAAAPASLMNIAFAQNGFWMAALVAGGLLRLERAPVLAGILIGLATIKPQLGLMIPLVLVLARAWIPLAIATATAAFMALASLFWLGDGVWLAWFSVLDLMAAETSRHVASLAPWLASVPAAMLASGLAGPPVWIAQLALIAGVGSLLLAIARTGNRRALVAAGLLATLAATPFSYVYDSVLALPAIILTFSSLAGPTSTRLGRVTLTALWFAPFLSIEFMPSGLPALPVTAVAVAILLYLETRGASDPLLPVGDTGSA